jgi:ketosteroid isomerase-like protein
VSNDLIALVEAMDRCWLERRIDDLAEFLAEDVVVVSPAGLRLTGLDKVTDSYREFMDRCTVERFEASGHTVTQRGDTAVVEYGWDMAWRDGDVRQQAKGREVLVFARRGGQWRVIWRTQVPAET